MRSLSLMSFGIFLFPAEPQGLTASRKLKYLPDIQSGMAYQNRKVGPNNFHSMLGQHHLTFATHLDGIRYRLNGRLECWNPFRRVWYPATGSEYEAYFDALQAHEVRRAKAVLRANEPDALNRS